MPNGVRVIFSVHKKKKGFVDLSFHASFSARLKNVIASLFPEKAGEIQNIRKTGWQLIPNEKHHIPLPEENRRGEYRKAWRINEKILDDSLSPFWDYARKDIEYLSLLDYYFHFPSPGLNDSMSEIVAWTRFRGFRIDSEGLEKYRGGLIDQLGQIRGQFPETNLLSAKDRKDYLNGKFHLGLKGTGKKAMDELKRKLNSGKNLDQSLFAFSSVNPIQVQADKILSEVREIEKFNALTQRKNQAKKLLEAGGAHPDFRIIGASTGRMTGTGGLNFQGIDRGKEGIRKYFLTSQGGDFGS